MEMLTLRIACIAVLAHLTALVELTDIAKPGQKLVIDHDGGADDAMAIFMALLYEEHFHGPKVVAITTSHGNVDESRSFENTQRILDIAGRTDIPIYRGCNSSFVYTYRSDGFFGSDGLGDLDNVSYTAIEAQPQHPAIVMIELSKQYEGELIVLGLGALTNIAVAVQLDPLFFQRISQLYVAAGNLNGNAASSVRGTGFTSCHLDGTIQKSILESQNGALLIYHAMLANPPELHGNAASSVRGTGFTSCHLDGTIQKSILESQNGALLIYHAMLANPPELHGLQGSPDVEFNAKADGGAYAVVVKNSTPGKVTVIPFSQIRTSFNISKTWRKEVLGKIPTRIMQAQNSFERVSISKNSTEWEFLDPAAMALILEPSVVTEYKNSLNGILLCGQNRGITTNDFTDANTANVRLVYSADEEKYKKLLIDIFESEL